MTCGLVTVAVMEKQQVLRILSVSVFLPLLFGIEIACTVLYCRVEPCLTVGYFSHFLINGTIFGKKNY
jgi:hypothetical protein